MNNEEIKELIEEIWRKCRLKSKDIEDMHQIQQFSHAYNIIEESLSLWINALIIDESALDCINKIAQEHGLVHHWIKTDSQKGLEIYTPKKNNN
ncbi:MAG: hypothetical protein QG670_1422 [Thermoproteota archaeon]|nr:hypothetical protein [Thermoproteota archaeon]